MYLRHNSPTQDILPAQPQGEPSPEQLAEQRLLHLLAQDRARRKLSGQPGRIEKVEELGLAETPTETTYRYNALGDLVEILEADGRRTGFEYDAQRRLSCVRYPDGGATFYRYAGDRLVEVNDRGLRSIYDHDADGRLRRVQRGSETAQFRYDEHGRLSRARAGMSACEWEYDSLGRINSLSQAFQGRTLQVRMEFGEGGRLAKLHVPGLEPPVEYDYDERGRPQEVRLDGKRLAHFEYEDESKTTRIFYANGVESELVANLTDGRPRRLTIHRDESTLLAQELLYGLGGEVLDNGRYRYEYDPSGRLSAARHCQTGQSWHFTYDSLDHRLSANTPQGAWTYQYDEEGRLSESRSRIDTETGAAEREYFSYDRWGRLNSRSSPAGEWSYLYDSAGRLVEARRDGQRAARFFYDYKDRLVMAELGDSREHYVYGPSDELLAVADGAGRPKYLLVRTPFGVLAELHFIPGGDAKPNVTFRHCDPQGSTMLHTGDDGQPLSRFDFTPFGLPQGQDEVGSGDFRAFFQDRPYYPELGLAYFGARWYDPALGLFLTPDSYSGAPDDERLVNPYGPASLQSSRRADVLNEWLKQPRLRNRYVFCGHDPAGRVDPNGHWSFGGVLLSLLGAIWTLPNTLFGLLVEITCLVGEVVRWLVWLVSFGNASWETPGFDAAASGRLNAFALVFTGGWLGSFPSLLGITFGNVFFVYKNWETSPHILSMPDPVHPPAYGGSESIPRQQALYEHELRHTNQYGMLGPFFHLGLPLFGFYEWDVIVNGYSDALLERDARKHAEEDPSSPTPTPPTP